MSRLPKITDPDKIARVWELYREGWSMDQIATAVHTGRSWVRSTIRSAEPVVRPVVVEPDRDPAPLPAGHPTTWGAISLGAHWPGHIGAMR